MFDFCGGQRVMRMPPLFFAYNRTFGQVIGTIECNAYSAVENALQKKGGYPHGRPPSISKKLNPPFY